MALPFEIQIGRISRFLSKWASTKGSSPRVTLGSEITPILNMWSGVENRFLDSWNRYASGIALPAGGAGFISAARIRNPSTSNVIAVFEKISGWAGTTGQLNLFLEAQTVDFATTMINNRLDPRANVATSSLVTSQKNNTATVGGTAIIDDPVVVGAGAGYDFILTDNQEIPLLPGDALTLTTNTANILLNCSFRWRERALEESERQ